MDKRNSMSFEKTLEVLMELQAYSVVKDKQTYEKWKLRYEQFVPDVFTTVGLKIEDLDKLKIIHVAGTKGKGSTCAFSESILRHHGFKTGSFTSPHLIEVNERIRINGLPIPKEQFCQYFWECYIPLLESKDRFNGQMPTSFFVMTLMAIKAFIHEKVDVAIIEVGLGGQFDVTNIVKNPIVCAVTSLALDHTVVLGDTLQEIAWHKSGIFKQHIPAATVSQKAEAQQTLMDRTKEIGAVLYMCSPLDPLENFQLGIPGKIQKYNAFLAIQLCSTWLIDHLLSVVERQNKYKKIIDEGQQFQQQNCTQLSDLFIKGLENCRWPGRCHTVETDHMTFYLDCAHTEESIEACAEWFENAIVEQKSANAVRVLMFNLTGGRQPMNLLKHLLKFKFDYAIFCPSTRTRAEAIRQGFLKDEHSVELQQCLTNKDTWLSLIENQPCSTHSSNYQTTTKESNDTLSCNQFTENSGGRKVDEKSINKCMVQVFPSIQESLNWLNKLVQNENKLTENVENEIKETDDSGIDSYNDSDNVDRVQVLCTGSTYLVGGVLHFIGQN